MSGIRSVSTVLRRNPSLGRLIASYAVFIVTEYAAWIAVLVLAYQDGGATAAGLVALAQLTPAALLAPVLAGAADRGSPVRVIVAGFLVQAAGMAIAAAAAAAGVNLLAYAGAIIASIAVVTIRPAQAAALPGLAGSPEELTAANVGLGWMENAGIVVSGGLSGGLLAASGPALVLAVMAALVLAGAVLVLPLRARHRPSSAAANSGHAGALAGFEVLTRGSAPRLLVTLLTAGWVVVGALDVLFVVLAIDLLDKGQAWTGYLQTAFGLGGLVAGAVTARLVGRHLAMPILVSGLALSAALAVTAAVPGALLTALLLAGVGAGRAVFDVGGRSLLQRAVPPHALGRVFGVLEGMSMAGLAVGSMLVPALVGIGGGSVAVLGVAALLPLAAAVGGRSLLTLDARATVPVVEISLLRSLRLFAHLPPPALESLGQSLQRQELAADDALISEGDLGDSYYIIAAGELEITRAGESLGLRGRGDGVGEIALLRDIPRTATVTAATAATVYRLGREPFLTAVTGHAATHAEAHDVVEERLRDTDPAGPAVGGDSSG